MSRIAQFGIAGAWIPLVLIALHFVGGSGGGVPAPVVRAAVPGIVPTFSNPTEFTNPFFPFQPGAMSVYAGRADGQDMTVVLRHLPDTRIFRLGEEEVVCVIIREVEFVEGAVVQTANNYYAQADDGTVYYFGETTETFANGDVSSTEGSWVVGEPAPDDPFGTISAGEPGIFMVAVPEVGDNWHAENLPEFQIVERDRVLRAVKRVKVPAGKFRDCIEVEEETDAPDAETERKIYAPGTGVIRVRGADERLKLVATSIRPR